MEGGREGDWWREGGRETGGGREGARERGSKEQDLESEKRERSSTHSLSEQPRAAHAG